MRDLHERTATMLGISESALIAVAGALPSSASAQTAPASGGLEEIVVTAQKRSENISKVPMTIEALSSDQLSQAHIQDTADLAKIVTGFQYAEAFTGSPIYFIRGVGFYDTAFASRGTTTIYIDQVPLPLSVFGSAATFDNERVEVLKGPQGTLFGQNATGGAVNYIAAKPTDHFAAGMDVSHGRDDETVGQDFIMRPLTANA